MEPVERLRETMRDRGMNQSELAERSGIHRVVINQILNYKRKLGTKTARIFERFLGLKYGSLSNQT
jgi:plasmid maintenance system antidote protein VapI